MDSSSQVELKLEIFRESCIETLKCRLGNASDLFAEDFLYFSAINRTIEVANSFVDAAKSQNLSVMPVLLRVQINTLATLNFIETIERKHEVIQEFNRGTEFRKMRVPGSKTKIQETLLIEKAEEKYPWIRSVYTKTSSWVHLSPTSTYGPLDMMADGTVTFRIPRIPEPRYQEAVDELCACMIACLGSIHNHLEIWASSNRNLDI